MSTVLKPPFQAGTTACLKLIASMSRLLLCYGGKLTSIRWPVIAAIVVGSIIVLSVLWCVASCLCCGASLCASCVRCMTCFGCCGACGNRGGGGGGRRSRHKDDYTQMPPTPYTGYQPQPSPMTYQPPAATPQFAQFDASTKKINEDSLPAMPSWDSARERRIEDHSEPPTTYRGQDVEMGRLGPAPQYPRTRGGYNQVPPGPVSPLSPPTDYGHFENQAPIYNHDLGPQRLGPQHTGNSGFNPNPLSPAPTYRTNAPSLVSAAHTDRFTSGAMSPTPQEYDDHDRYGSVQNHAWSPSAHPHHEAIDYQAYGSRSLSPTHSHQVSNLSYQEDSHASNRPPSLLQVGRKPVVGSQREI